jgi:hypothetical protein
MRRHAELLAINPRVHAHRTGMRSLTHRPLLSALLATVACAACSGDSVQGFQMPNADGGGLDDAHFTPSGVDGSQVLGPGSTTDTGTPQGGTTVTTIYANTDDSLYSLDPMTNAVSLIGQFSGLGGGSGDDSVTDCAVNAEGVVYVNSESAVYRAALPAGTGTVVLTKVASIALASDQKFYALAFAPAGVLGATETLVGGDGNGELWSIDTTSGATRDLGSFGADPSDSKDILALSGDIVFYSVGGTPTGIATIRACKSSGGSCTTTDDYLAGIDMAALAAAYTSGAPATSLLGGIYGGSSGNTGAGTGFGELFGLGVWEGNVFGFGRSESSNPPSLVAINPGTGVGNLISSAFNFTDGWSGAGVSTTTTVTIAAPPPIK